MPLPSPGRPPRPACPKAGEAACNLAGRRRGYPRPCGKPGSRRRPQPRPLPPTHTPPPPPSPCRSATWPPHICLGGASRGGPGRKGSNRGPTGRSVGGCGVELGFGGGWALGVLPSLPFAAFPPPPLPRRRSCCTLQPSLGHLATYPGRPGRYLQRDRKGGGGGGSDRRNSYGASGPKVGLNKAFGPGWAVPTGTAFSSRASMVAATLSLPALTQAERPRPARSLSKGPC
jgi:hypothetical protein